MASLGGVTGLDAVDGQIADDPRQVRPQGLGTSGRYGVPGSDIRIVDTFLCIRIILQDAQGGPQAKSPVVSFRFSDGLLVTGEVQLYDAVVDLFFIHKVSPFR